MAIDGASIREELQAKRPVSILGVGLSREDWVCIRRSTMLWGPILLSARCCREALHTITDRAPHIVISGSELPDGTWRDILAASRRLAVPPPVIVAAHSADEGMWVEVLDLGGYDLIARPLDTGELGWILVSALNLARSSLTGNMRVGRVNAEENLSSGD